MSELLRRLGLRAPRGRPPASSELDEAEWELAALAQRLGMPPVTLYTWIGRSWVRARQLALTSPVQHDACESADDADDCDVGNAW